MKKGNEEWVMAAYPFVTAHGHVDKEPVIAKERTVEERLNNLEEKIFYILEKLNGNAIRP